MQIGEVATAAAGDEDLLANAIGVLQHGDPAATLAGFDGAHQSGCAAAENNYVEGLVGQVISFKFQVSSFKSKVNWGVEQLDAATYLNGGFCKRRGRTLGHRDQQERSVVSEVPLSVTAHTIHDVAELLG